MIYPNYQVSNHHWALRWETRESFLKEEKKIRNKNKNTTAIICLYYSSLYNIKLLFDYIAKEKNSQNFDLILIDNSPLQTTDFAKEVSNDNLIVLSPLTNLGTDWWYALGVEYCIKNWYEYLFLLEDDVIFLENNVFSVMDEAKDKNSIIFLSDPINTIDDWLGHSRYVQIVLYPIAIFQKIWIMDPRQFTRGWELPFIMNIEKYVKLWQYNTKIIKKDHFHPYLKKNNRSAWWIYFVRRNRFENIKYNWWFYSNIAFLAYIRMCFSQILLEGCFIGWIALWKAIYDFLYWGYTLWKSLKRMGELAKLKRPQITDTTNTIIWAQDLADITSWCFIFKNCWTNYFTSMDTKYFHGTTKFSAFWKKWIIIPNTRWPLYSIAMLAPKIIAVNENNILDATYDISIIKPKVNCIWRYVSIILALWIASIIWILLLIPINLKIFYCRFRK